MTSRHREWRNGSFGVPEPGSQAIVVHVTVTVDTPVDANWYLLVHVERSIATFSKCEDHLHRIPSCQRPSNHL